ncbi:MAG: ABC-2 family transporter protein [Oscillospiraceae bacterium]|jgi:ABC-2 type transport system permease protein|nr:ABC-2 family transporter protein [Oscillospiraceae bacterium]
MRPNFATLSVACREKFQGGLGPLLFGFLLKGGYLLPLLFLWRALAQGGADLGGYTLPGLLSYTCASSLLAPLLNVRSPMSNWHYDGRLIDLLRRPRPVFIELVAQTVGEWVPTLLLYSLPMGVALTLLGVRVLPQTLWALPCLALGVSLGFAVDFLFSCFIIHMKDASWVAHAIRAAVTSLLSGAVIPFDLLPWGLGRLFGLLPLGSLAGAPLAVYVGARAALPTLAVQAFWNAALWPLAALAFRRSRERMVSYGG